jgi:hypothetical protein
MDYFKLLADQARKHLLELAARVTDVVPIDIVSFRVQTCQLNPEIEQRALLDKVSAQIGGDHLYLYYFQVVNNIDLAEVKRTFLNTKEREKNRRAYPRFNCQSEFLYVGSSFNISQRFKEHLGYGSKMTYSLQLAHWASNLNLELDFIYAKYPEDIVHDVIQIIEDTLWDELHPMFGRRGQR